MKPENLHRLQARVVAAAEAALARQHYVSAIDVLQGLDWLARPQIEAWRGGRVAYLEAVIHANLSKISVAMKELRRWAEQRGLQPSETAYLARSRGPKRDLQFSKSGDPGIEQRYRTHWVSPALSAAKQERLRTRKSKPPDLVAILPLSEPPCCQCGQVCTLLIMEGPGPLCMACADMDHLVFLRSGNAALSRRAKAASRLSAVVVRFSRARKRYERQGVLVEAAALEQAEAACLADEEIRAARRVRDEERRTNEDLALVDSMAAAIATLFPGCSAAEGRAIARHTATRGSGRVGRSSAGRELDSEALTLAVVAAVRHAHTSYDELLMSGMARGDARATVQAEVDRVLDTWRRPASNAPSALRPV